jgi:methylmalonyl-CoA mutase cobalamin-binding domain/chain
MMMEGAGFKVVNLGINNDAEKFINAIKEHEPDIVGMSALLTTTMPYMEVVIKALKEQGLRDKVLVLVGGAPLNAAFAEEIEADAYCRDAAVAVDTAKKLIAIRRNGAH